jgi:type I restriction enzyme, S subunit
MNEVSTLNLHIIRWTKLDKWTIPRTDLFQLKIPESWSILPIHKIVKQVTNREKVISEKQYRMIGVKWYGEGTFERETVLGQNISANWVTPVVPNAFIYNRLFAWKESFAIVPKEHAGQYVSNEFPQFIADENTVLPTYLYLVFLQPNIVKIVKGSSIGSAAVSRNRLKEEDFLKFEIPIPPLEVQQKIIDFWLKAKHISKSLVEESEKIKENIENFILSELGIQNKKYSKKTGVILSNFKKINQWGVDFNSYNWDLDELLESSNFPMVFLNSITEINPSIQYTSSDLDLDVSFIPMSYVSEKTKKIEKMDKRKLKDVMNGYTRFRENDIIFAKITPCMENGKCVVAKNLFNGIGFGSTEFHVIKPNQEKIIPEFLCLILRLQLVRDNAQRFFIGSAGQKRVPAEFLEKIKIPLPSLAKQKEIVNQVNSYDQEIEEKRKRSQQIIDIVKQELELIIEARKNVEDLKWHQIE